MPTYMICRPKGVKEFRETTKKKQLDLLLSIALDKLICMFLMNILKQSPEMTMGIGIYEISEN